MPFTPGAKKALELSLREAIAAGDREIGPEHVLLGSCARAARDALLRAAGAEPAVVRRGAQPGGESSRTRSVISSSARAASGCSPAR